MIREVKKQGYSSEHAVIYVLLLFCAFSLAEITEASDEKPTSYKILEHKSFSISCNVTEEDDLEIYWTKNVTNSDFYQTGSNLTFDDILRFDSGDYVCHALNTSLPGDNETNNNFTVEVINIDVLFPAEIAGFLLSPDNVTENGSYTIQCNFMGNPQPTWEIRNNHTKQAFLKAINARGNVTLGPNGTSAVCGDTGYIECTGYNELSHGINVTQGTNFTVYCSPRPNPDAPTQNRSISFVGGYAYFILNVVGYPYPSYVWSRADGKPMPQYSQIDYPSFTFLNISHIKISDFGKYLLTMNNSMGTSTIPFGLQAMGRPQSPFNLTYSDVTYYSVNLSWVSGFDMGSRQHFIVMKLVDSAFIQTSNTIYGDYKNDGVNQHWSYTLFNLDSDTVYTLSLVAQNDDGYTSQLAKPSITFRTKVDPHHQHKSGDKTAIIAGSVAGGVVFIGLLAFLVYFVKYRNMRVDYQDLGGRTKK